MSIRILALTALLALPALAAPTGVSAQRAFPAFDAPYEPGPDFQSCIKMCPEDDSPCDPAYFKTADRRCQAERGGRGHHR